MADWRALLGKHVGTSRQLLRKLLDQDTRFVLNPMADAKDRWYEMAVTPSLDKLLGAVPTPKKAVAAPICASWNQLDGWLKVVDGLRCAA